MTEKTVRTGDRSVYYSVSGEGPAVVLLHGFGEDGRVWESLQADVSNHHKTIAVDLPGSGRSSGISANDSMETLAEAVAAVVDAEQLSSCAMIGHSMGGYVSLAFAEKYPGKLNKLGLFHSTSFPDSEEKKLARQRNIEFIRRHGAEKFLEQSIPTLFSKETNEKNPGLVQSTVQRYSNFSADSLVQYTAAMMNRPGRTGTLKGFSGPILFICGEHDTAIPLEQSLNECHLAGNSYIYVCTHSGHSGMLEEPEFCINAVGYFLSGK